MKAYTDLVYRALGFREFPNDQEAYRAIVTPLSNEKLATLAEALRDEVLVRKQKGEMPSSLVPFVEDAL